LCRHRSDLQIAHFGKRLCWGQGAAHPRGAFFHVKQIGNLFNRKPASQEAGDGVAPDQDALSVDELQNYSADGLNSVQGDPDGYAAAAASPIRSDEDVDLISLPLLGEATAATHQRRLLILLALGVAVLALIATWVLQQADRSAQQLTATGQSLMQSQRLAKSVSQALVGSPQAFPDVVESSGVLARNVRALNAGDSDLNVQALGESFKTDLDAVTPLMERAEKNASVVMGQQKILTQVGDALRTINRQSSDLLEIAETVQRALLPTTFPQVDGYEFYASYDSAQAVGGDYFDVFPLPDGKIVLSFGDVAGKGVPGALIMSRMSSCVQSTIRHVTDLEEAICAINDHMCDSAVEGRFVTYILAIVDPATHTFKISNAGHMSPIIRRASGAIEQFNDELVGPPIGVVDGYPFDTETKSLEPGDLIVLFTDGVDEAMNYQDELYGGDRLLEFVKNGPAKADELGKALLADVRKHANGRPQNDDITIMAFGRNPA